MVSLYLNTYHRGLTETVPQSRCRKSNYLGLLEIFMAKLDVLSVVNDI